MQSNEDAETNTKEAVQQVRDLMNPQNIKDPVLREYFMEHNQFQTQVEREKLKLNQKLGAQDKHTLNGKVYERRKITFGQERELERLRGKWESLIKLKDKPQSTQIYAEIYIKSAEYYLGIPALELDNFNWEEVRDIIDACAWRTRYGSFLSTNNSSSSSSPAK